MRAVGTGPVQCVMGHDDCRNRFLFKLCTAYSGAEIMDFRCIFDRNELTTEFIKVMKETEKISIIRRTLRKK